MYMRSKRIIYFLLVLAALIIWGCNRSESVSDQKEAIPKASPRHTPSTPFENDLEYVRKGQFHQIYVISRKDGGQFQPDDITYLKANSPQQTNMWVSTNEGRSVIAGTNFDFKPEHFEALGKKFTVEDYTNK